MMTDRDWKRLATAKPDDPVWNRKLKADIEASFEAWGKAHAEAKMRDDMDVTDYVVRGIADTIEDDLEWERASDRNFNLEYHLSRALGRVCALYLTDEESKAIEREEEEDILERNYPDSPAFCPSMLH